jgi:hypothetical protein
MAINRAKDLTSSRLPSWIIEPWVLIGQLVPVTKRANLLKSKFFGAVACPKTGIEEFSTCYQ